MDRLHFLKNVWKPYPLVPAGWTAGRLHAFTETGVSLRRLKNITTFPVSEISVLKQVLIPGDWVAISPQQEWRLLAPALKVPRSLRTDPELLASWTEFLKQVRLFFSQKGFQEVSTPTLVTCPGTEPYLDPVAAGSGKFLPTSPELHLKKALSMGLGPLFEIRPCFRDREISERHQPEFWMLEWYRPLVDLAQIKKDVVDLVQFLSNSSSPLKFNEQTLAGLFQEKLGFDLTPETSKQDLVLLAKSLGLFFEDSYSWDDLFNLIFVDQLEKSLGQEAPLFLENYPPEMAALARLTEDGWGDRFEFYWKGFEIANAFHELNDPTEQLRRAQEDNAKKTEIGKVPVPVDFDFIDALLEGMPPSSGIALGLERLFMCLTGTRSFSEFRVFSES